MDFLAIIAANALFLVLVAIAVRLDRRISRIEEHSRNDISRLNERLFNVNRGVQTLQSTVEALSPAAVKEIDERAVLAERQFAEAIEEIMSYCAPKTSDTEAMK